MHKRQLVIVRTGYHQLIQFVWVLHLTFLFSTMRSRTTQNKHVNLLKKRSMMQLQNWIHYQKNHTKTQLLSCSYYVIT